MSASSQSRSRSGSASGSRSDDESVDVDIDGDIEEYQSPRYRAQYGLTSRGRYGVAWKKEEDELSIGFSLREEDEDDADDIIITGTPAINKIPDSQWDEMEMEMDMD